MDIRCAPLAEIDASTLYRILALRTNVFVVEQNCAYAELDGRDLEPSTRLFWAESGAEVAATLRVLTELDGSARIGRVATAQAHRGSGLAARLISDALNANRQREIWVHAQARLAPWYAGFDFVRSGPEYVEDGIAHVPMLRSAEAIGRPPG